jgi:SAM-dependent methyltransferase
VWTGQPLDELLGQDRRSAYDFFIASHVIEHFPDLLGFLKEVETLLKVSGILSLVVPDKRYCFDFFKPLTLTGSILAAHRNRATRHSKCTAFEHVAYSCWRDSAGTWERQSGELGLFHTLEETFSIFCTLDDSPTAPHVDFHRWFFVPSSFRLILEELRLIGEITFEVAQSFDTAGCEFFVSLRKTGVKSVEAPGSPAVTARRLALLKQIAREVAEQTIFE